MALRFKPFATIGRFVRSIPTILVRLFRSKKLRVAILGRPQVGKTALLVALGGGASAGVRSTSDLTVSREFSVRIRGKAVQAQVHRDLQGVEGIGYADWKHAFLGADTVLYLFRADLIVQGDRDEVLSVKGELDMFKMWLGPKRARRPRIVLVGTWADDAAQGQGLSKLRQTVSKSAPIKSAVVKLNNAGLVVGSLRTEHDSARLVNSLSQEL